MIMVMGPGRAASSQTPVSSSPEHAARTRGGVPIPLAIVSILGRGLGSSERLPAQPAVSRTRVTTVTRCGRCASWRRRFCCAASVCWRPGGLMLCRSHRRRRSFGVRATASECCTCRATTVSSPPKATDSLSDSESVSAWAHRRHVSGRPTTVPASTRGSASSRALVTSAASFVRGRSLHAVALVSSLSDATEATHTLAGRQTSTRLHPASSCSRPMRVRHASAPSSRRSRPA